MHVEESGSSFIDALTQVGIRLVRGAEQHGVGLGQSAIERFSGRGAGYDSDSEWVAGGVDLLGPFGNGSGNGFGRACGSEPAEGDSLAILDVLGSLGRC
jgi:hypothetical protein